MCLTLVSCRAYEKAKIDSTTVGLQVVQSAAELHWAMEGGTCPSVTTLVGLQLLAAEEANDAWGHEIAIVCGREPGGLRITARSNGPDGVAGSADDLSASGVVGAVAPEATRDR